jgi:hypothetical protein
MNNIETDRLNLPWTVQDLTETTIRDCNGRIIFDAADTIDNWQEAKDVTKFIVEACNNYSQLSGYETAYINSCQKIDDLNTVIEGLKAKSEIDELTNQEINGNKGSIICNNDFS